jgi:3-deoxy-manno-octulosonate cytidylyltransferase (CMP-KDO synthetase)
MGDNVLVVIPARMAAERFPGKPLKSIGGKPMIVHVWEQAKRAEIGDVIVACGDPEIKDAIQRVGGQAVLTDPQLPSGTDRIHAALHTYDPAGQIEIIVNVQGDLPQVHSSLIQGVLQPLSAPSVAMSTVAMPLQAEDIQNDHAVKVFLEEEVASSIALAHNFKRQISNASDNLRPALYHVGIYAYRRWALDKFVTSPQADREKAERLEQLRALSLGLRIGVFVCRDHVRRPISIDRPKDLEKLSSFP